MNAAKRERLIQQVLQVLRYQTGTYDDPDILQRDDALVRRSLAGRKIEDNLRTMAQHLLKEQDWADKFSSKYLVNQCRELLNALPENLGEREVGDIIDALIRELSNYNVVQTVFIPLAGVDLHIDELALYHFRVLPMSPQRVEQMLQDIDDGLAANPDIDDERGKNLRSSFEAMINSLTGKVCAEFKAVGEPERISERVAAELDILVELLRYSAFLLSESIAGLSIGVHGEHLIGSKFTIMIPSHFNGWFHGMNQEGAFDALSIDERANQRIQDTGLLKVAEIYRKPIAARTEFEAVILRCVHWCAESGQTDAGCTRYPNPDQWVCRMLIDSVAQT